MPEPLDQPDPTLPPDLTSALRGAFGRGPAVPGRVDDAVLSAAHDAFARRRRLRLIVRWGTGVGTMAAAAVLAIALRPAPTAPDRPPLAATGPAAPATTTARGDLDGDRRVDMVDALLLARRLRAGPLAAAEHPAWDLTGDGRIDAADVDAIAAAAVRLAGPQPGAAHAPAKGPANAPAGAAITLARLVHPLEPAEGHP